MPWEFDLFASAGFIIIFLVFKFSDRVISRDYAVQVALRLRDKILGLGLEEGLAHLSM